MFGKLVSIMVNWINRPTIDYIDFLYSIAYMSDLRSDMLCESCGKQYALRGFVVCPQCHSEYTRK